RYSKGCMRLPARRQNHQRQTRREEERCVAIRIADRRRKPALDEVTGGAGGGSRLGERQRAQDGHCSSPREDKRFTQSFRKGAPPEQREYEPVDKSPVRSVESIDQ